MVSHRKPHSVLGAGEPPCTEKRLLWGGGDSRPSWPSADREAGRIAKNPRRHMLYTVVTEVTVLLSMGQFL